MTTGFKTGQATGSRATSGDINETSLGTTIIFSVILALLCAFAVMSL